MRTASLSAAFNFTRSRITVNQIFKLPIRKVRIDKLIMLKEIFNYGNKYEQTARYIISKAFSVSKGTTTEDMLII